MTREEAIIILDCERPYGNCGCGASIEEIEDALNMAIKALEQEPRWIPVSERLPEEAFGCLVTVEEDDIHGEPHGVIYPDFVGYDGETWNDVDGEPISFEVIAWMPLPESYESQESEE